MILKIIIENKFFYGFTLYSFDEYILEKINQFKQSNR